MHNPRRLILILSWPTYIHLLLDAWPVEPQYFNNIIWLIRRRWWRYSNSNNITTYFTNKKTDKNHCLLVTTKLVRCWYVEPISHSFRDFFRRFNVTFPDYLLAPTCFLIENIFGFSIVRSAGGSWPNKYFCTIVHFT